ncbi:uncharacterized protein LOC141910290 [Tubulanus polymorphus]|uniref:uncharacterized protein LOC141910290 n=1 Tax=Tubulanus polymorphus TaxID=672921 RepID=UPI003DA54155
MKLGWDDEIPVIYEEKWRSWLAELPSLESLRIGRCFKPSNFGDVCSAQLHHFSDASERGYGAVSYKRLVNAAGEIHCSLIMAKSRVTPLRIITIPRLELAAATATARLDRLIRNEIGIQVETSYFWTVSTAVLKYIRNENLRFQVNVANRISIIRDLTTPDQWFFVNGADNPADDASRGFRVQQFPDENSRWLTGPAFLSSLESEWPNQPDVEGWLNGVKVADPITVHELRQAEKAVLSYVQPLYDHSCTAAQISDLIIQEYHEMYGHSGRDHILSENKMADLPEERVTPCESLFTYVGVDFFGPFLVKQLHSQVKRYGCIFTCLFMERRGTPTCIWSDNGTIFVGGNRELRDAIQDWNKDKIHVFLLQKEIEWHFNPPTASHIGGVWKRQIRTVRNVLAALMKVQDDEGLCTLMCEVEAVINSRSITAVSNDPLDLEAPPPNHLLLLTAGSTLPPAYFKHETSGNAGASYQLSVPRFVSVGREFYF